MSRRDSGHRRSPLLRTLFLILWMSGIALVLYIPLYIRLAMEFRNEHLTVLLLATSAFLPTFGAAVYASIPKVRTSEHILSAVIAICGHGILSFGLMAAYSILFGVENLSQVILLTLAWIPAILVSTITSLVGTKREGSLRRRGLCRVYASLSPTRARILSILGGILFALWIHTANGLLYMVALLDSGSVLAGIIFPMAWALFAVYRPFAPRRRAYVLSAILTGMILSTATYILSATAYNIHGLDIDRLFDITFRHPLTSPAIALTLPALALTTILPLIALPGKTQPEAVVVNSLN